MGNEQNPLFSILIPTRDEEQYLPECLSAVRLASSHFNKIHPTQKNRVEVVVILNRCTDRTEEIALSEGCKTVRDESKNLAMIRNAGAKEARGEILITIDADSRMAENMLVEIYATLTGARYIGGGVLTYPNRWSLGICLTGVALLPVLLWHGVSAGLFFCYRSDFEAIGGFNEKKVSIEDLDFAIRLKSYGKKQGKKFAHLFRTHIVTSCRKFDRFGDWYFIYNLKAFYTLLRGDNQEKANEYWYDFKR